MQRCREGMTRPRKCNDIEDATNGYTTDQNRNCRHCPNLATRTNTCATVTLEVKLWEALLLGVRTNQTPSLPPAS